MSVERFSNQHGAPRGAVLIRCKMRYCQQGSGCRSGDRGGGNGWRRRKGLVIFLGADPF